jgi:hypothetical protein
MNVTRRFGRSAAGVLILVAAASLVAAGNAQGGHQEPCNHPITGEDLNERYGISEQFVAPFCPELGAGQRWRAPGPSWFMNTAFDAVPEEFEPAGDTPLEDFQAKFVGYRYVIDGGTKDERNYLFTNTEDLWIGDFDGFPDVSPVLMISDAATKPLKVGEHTVARFWVMDGVHCDGFGADIENNCLPDGEVLFAVTTFEVVADHHG